MRPEFSMRNARAVHLTAGALILAVPGTAIAFSAAQNAAAAPAAPSIAAKLSRSRVAYDGRLTVSGNASSSQAGRVVQLEFERAGSTVWRGVATTRVGPRGGFRLTTRLRRSGAVRVAGYQGVSQARSSRAAAAPLALAPSNPARVAVSSAFDLPTKQISVLAGQSVRVNGKLLPAVAGRNVRLMKRAGRRWTTVASTRTGSHGGFRFHYVAGAPGRITLRVGFAGDRDSTRSWSRAGTLTTYRESVASWYNDAGSTACGFHATYGVANKTLPCGTKVTFHYNGRTVIATVDDRGPFVAGREWDFNQNLAGALGMGGVATVWSSI